MSSMHSYLFAAEDLAKECIPGTPCSYIAKGNCWV